MERALQFLVMLDGPTDERRILDAVRQAFPDATPVKANSCDLRGNWLEAWTNEDHDPDLAANDDEDAFLYFRWRVEVTPMADGITEDDQVTLAKGLVACFTSNGWTPIVAAAFEDRV
ncbi:hypothetical protein ACSNOI_02575 [Actinomadura kijaniata]|uniref:hypothetical protein n=1 Tax=Actinomadura kijaniata TaxID=46161 RepID=UPI003F1960D3